MRLVSIIVALCLMSSTANAACKGKGNAARNRVANVNVGVNNAVRQVVAGNQLVSLDRFGNVVNRQFVNARNVNVGVGIGGRNLAERLLGL